MRELEGAVVGQQRKDFAMGKVDELCCDGCKGNDESDVVDMVEGHCTRVAVTVARVRPMDGEERVGKSREVAWEGKSVVDVYAAYWETVRQGDEGRGRRAYVDGHEDVWEGEFGHLGTLCGCLGSETL